MEMKEEEVEARLKKKGGVFDLVVVVALVEMKKRWRW